MPPQSNAAGSDLHSGTIVFVPDVQDLCKIHDDHVQLAVWRRPDGIPDFITALSDPSLPVTALPTFEGIVDLRAKAKVAHALLTSTRKLAAVVGDHLVDQFVRDLELLVEAFAAVVGGVDRVKVKLEHLKDNGCQYWHQDCVPYRLVATYRGPCTEFVDPAHSAATLRRRKNDTEHAQSLTLCDVALFKGRGGVKSGGGSLLGHPGIVHRSPRILGSGADRLVLTLNLPDDAA